MAGLTHNKCQVIPEAVTKEAFGEDAANYAEDAAEICAIATGNLTEYGRKDCGGTKTPPLHWGGVTVESKQLPLEFSFDIVVWVGVEKTAGKNYLWIGMDAGSAGSFCIDLKEGFEEGASVAYDTLASAFQDLLDEVEKALDNGAALYLILGAASAVFVVAVLPIIATIISSSSSSVVTLTVAGSVGIGIIGAAIVAPGS